MQEAYECCEKVLEVMPDNPDVLNLGAEILIGMNEFDRAEETLKNSLDIDSKYWRTHLMRSRLYDKRGQNNSIEAAGHALSLCLESGENDSPTELMERCLEKVIARPETMTQEIYELMVIYGNLMTRYGGYDESAGDLLKDIAGRVARQNIHGIQLLSLLNILSFDITSSRAWNMEIYRLLAVPGLRREVDAGDFRYVLAIESLIYVAYIKQKETEENFRGNYLVLAPLLVEAGKKAGEVSPSLQDFVPDNSKPVIAFLVNSAVLLAHTEVLLSYLQGCRNMQDIPFIPRVYVLKGMNEEFANRFMDLQVEVVYMDQHAPEQPDDNYLRLLSLRDLLAQQNVTAIVWVSLPPFMIFAYVLRMAPVQIWWSMKYHGIQIPEIHGYVTGGSLLDSKIIDGQEWRTAPVAYNIAFSRNEKDEALKIRMQYSAYDLVIGTIGREEKLSDPVFCEVIAGLLKRNSNVAFLWAGREQLSSIQKTFDAAGVADRCFFIGWVNTKVYAHVLDIFLDSFPFPCTFTLVEAMAAGKPVVLYESKESYKTGLHGIISPFVNSNIDSYQRSGRIREIFRMGNIQPLYLCADDTLKYVEYAEKLIQDDIFRNEVGKACQRFANEFLFDVNEMAAKYTRHFMEIIDCTLNKESQ